MKGILPYMINMYRHNYRQLKIALYIFNLTNHKLWKSHLYSSNYGVTMGSQVLQGQASADDTKLQTTQNYELPGRNFTHLHSRTLAKQW